MPTEKIKLNEAEAKDIIAEWNADAKRQTLATLPEFLRHLCEDYDHDYGTIAHAVAAAACAAAWAVHESPVGGITNFQAGAVMWLFMQHWYGVEFPARLIKYEDMLYPQYEQRFAKTLDVEAWNFLQEKAKSRLADPDGMHPTVRAHMQCIADGVVPFGYSVV